MSTPNSPTFNKAPYLRNQRSFPEETKLLSVEIDKSYVDIARAINSRSIGLFATGPIVTGNVWYTTSPNEGQQTVRQVFTFTSTASIDHNIANVVPGQFVFCFGSFTDDTNDYGLIYASSVAIAGQICFYVTSTQIVFTSGVGAPSLTSGNIVLEWLSPS